MRNKLKALISIILILVTLTSCAPEVSGGEGTSGGGSSDIGGTNTGEPETPIKKPGVVLYDNNTAYKIVYGENASEAVINIANDFAAALDAMTDAVVTVTTDRLEEGEEPGALEILIANTNRPESKETIKDLAYSDYSIKISDSKVVIAALNESTLTVAINYTLENLLVIDGEGSDKALRLQSGFIYKTGAWDIITCAEDFSEYKIVYSYDNESMRGYAEELANQIYKYCGIRLECIDDTYPITLKEILLGTTTRTETDYIADLEALDYSIRTIGRKIVIGARTDYVTPSAIDAFANTFLSGTYTDGVRIAGNYDSSELGKATIKDAYDPTLAAGADLRIMSFNILAELWDNDAMATLPGRDENVANILLTYLPDVVALQENTPMWYGLLEERLKGVYQYAIYYSVDTEAEKIPCYSTIMYNTLTTELIECTTTIYSVRNSRSSRVLTVARMRRKADGAEFIVTNTHWDITDDKRQEQLKENAKWINDLQAEYNVPIFSCGDYNSDENNLFKKFLQNTKMTDPRYTAVTVVNQGRTTHTLSLNPDGNANTPCIDHIAVREGQDVLFYNRLTLKEALDASDHCPIYIDVKLNTEE